MNLKYILDDVFRNSSSDESNNLKTPYPRLLFEK